MVPVCIVLALLRGRGDVTAVSTAGSRREKDSITWRACGRLKAGSGVLRTLVIATSVFVLKIVDQLQSREVFRKLL